ncbi:hypothetical protein DL95DRAFT_419000 [Leptodontidium sp. 2 PMI_412]|nr:hypothetical protein DL95DRAFT_419000 [Leptodontidium sp. 2 PMI_412]
MQVGFSLQADLMASGSLLHATTGRLLKALSDGGVDFYAVAAAIHLGKQFPIQTSHETEVSSLLSARAGRAGYLAKALNIGWGHSDIAIELARTRAGTSALLTIGALATGATIYETTQAFAELLSLGGCPAEEMPNIDALKTMVTYLAPFMADFGFRRVFQYIVTASRRRCSEAGCQSPIGLEAKGEATEWAKVVRQLVFTAQRTETLYLQVAQRGAWIAAYASHILCMAVQVLLEEVVLWESAGTAGAVCIQLAQSMGKKQISIADNERFHIVVPPTTNEGQQAMALDYAIGEALAAEISFDKRITPAIADSIERAIVRLCATLRSSLRMNFRNSPVYVKSYHRINGTFSNLDSDLGEQCAIFGISPQNFETGISTRSQRIKAWSGRDGTVIQDHGLQYLDLSEAIQLRHICGSHGANPDRPIIILHCLCCRIGGIIHGFGVTILALMQCIYDPSELRIQADVVNSSRLTPWTRIAISGGLKVEGLATAAYLFVHLSQLVHGLEALKESDILGFTGIDVLAVSIDNVSIYYRALLDSEAFDSKGRTMTIVSGRISYRGVLRRLVKEETGLPFGNLPGYPEGNSARMTDGFVVVPHYAKGPIEAVMEVTLGEDAFWIKCRLTSQDRSQSGDMELSLCIYNLLLTTITGPCSHKKNHGWSASKEFPINIVTLSGPRRKSLGQDNTVFAFALKGSTLEQLFQIGILGPRLCVIQGESCLKCAVQEYGIGKSLRNCIIMT